MIDEQSFLVTNAKYGDGIAIDEYDGKISIVAAQQGRDDQIYARWVFPQTKDRTPTDKAIPLKITIGNDKADAINTLEVLLACLGKQPDAPEPPPVHPLTQWNTPPPEHFR